MRKVVQTKSEEKLNRYKNVLIRKMFEKDDSEMFAKYLSLLDEVNDTQILILTSFNSMSPFKISEIVGHLENPNGGLNHLVNIIEKNDIKLSDGTFLGWNELKFFLYDLKSKGIIDAFDNRELQHGSQNITYASSANETFRLSIIGEGFLEFIKEYGE
jgi:hypothetical protein